MEKPAASPLAPLPPPPGQARIDRPPIGLEVEVGSIERTWPRQRAATEAFVGSITPGNGAVASMRKDRPFSFDALEHSPKPYNGGRPGGGIVVPVQGGQVYESVGSVVNVQGGKRLSNRAPHNIDAIPHGKVAADPIGGLYIAKTAVIITACYLGIQLLITFEEVLLPFIFAVLVVVILEPLKKFVMRVFYRVVMAVSTKLNLKICIETKVQTEQGRIGITARSGSVAVSEGGHIYGSLPEDSNAEDASTEGMQVVTVPAPSVQKIILFFSIIFCCLVTGRVMWLTAKVFIKAGAVISANLDFYKRGADRCKNWVEDYVHSLNFHFVNWAHVLDDIVTYVETIGSIMTKSILYTVAQAVVSLIFILYMLWSPIKMDSNTTSQTVFLATGRYLKVKCLISAFTGCCVCISLWAIGLDLPAAFGFLAFLCNFLPGIGSVVASVLPCVLAIIDVRKTLTQVFIAFLSQLVVHFFIDFVVEPVFFGRAVEIHSVIVILGIWFFCKVWGVAGMLLSVPLLAVMRLMLRSMSESPGRDAETAELVDSILQGRWMSSVGDDVDMDELLTGSQGFAIDMDLALGEEAASEAIERMNAGIFWGNFKKGASIWDAIFESPAGQEVSRIYGENRLTLDILMLVGLVISLTVVPL
jgi:predicted PurR-regulated permease PerM